MVASAGKTAIESVSMGLFLLFGRKKQDPTAPVEVPVSNKLQELCGGDEELYRVLSNLMFLDPEKITIPLETVLSEARDFEMKGNNLRAEVGYRIAGGISLFNGDVDGVRSNFSRAASLAVDSHREYNAIVKRAKDAVSVARKYYEADGVKGP